MKIVIMRKVMFCLLIALSLLTLSSDPIRGGGGGGQGVRASLGGGSGSGGGGGVG